MSLETCQELVEISEALENSMISSYFEMNVSGGTIDSKES